MKYKTTWTKKENVKREWYIIDAKDQIVGRVATKIASLLIGKDKPQIVPNVDCGDYVIVLNTDKLKLTRGKEFKKMYYSHSGFPGGLKEIVFDDQMKKDSSRIIISAVKNMLPKNKQRDLRMGRLFTYKGGEHENQAQQPKEYKL
ncbi:50S ribosomal protein L13 [candidate division WS6 bacterium RIFOXYD1_FULL_33_8]|uniref:Large ribosomal subunit protein uL13 n=2 Tax=Candidatus Dojkabacteria TaxID=74243 RepID=A0A0G0AT96_9BACT|nr:MAG: 50S ribosomal protein L13, large subunit ribosomal protein L13 [candidate division WS6 bacterium GW2011_GWE2_33_157]KKP44539.1 MAG: 50S ribosomal protein L13, large subunit ribosomal protein L13 [candidate division WS6 bacterium GW2011_GWC1_33_20]KKP46151.1 MAG: 50S ribosomal protein L13, large subunit ribosomal protein L13 [candidate division WS6 bacterium GW2011_GWF1_33_233]KKP54636.1 MAG: 50S ribosomal protein L13 [candidate division WS6 bacterium GW2011_GWB1_33_6]KKP55415.1 MAG: 50S